MEECYFQWKPATLLNKHFSMGVFRIFKILQIVGKYKKHYICLLIEIFKSTIVGRTIFSVNAD